MKIVHTVVKDVERTVDTFRIYTRQQKKRLFSLFRFFFKIV